MPHTREFYPSSLYHEGLIIGHVFGSCGQMFVVVEFRIARIMERRVCHCHGGTVVSLPEVLRCFVYDV